VRQDGTSDRQLTRGSRNRPGRRPALLAVAVVGALALGLVTILVFPIMKVTARPGTPFNVLQLNLCNSGLASCYAQGRSIPEAQELIRAVGPDVVTVNEICERDLQPLAQALGRTGMRQNWNFVPTRNRQAQDYTRCRNGDRFGVAVLWRADNRTDRGGRSWVYSRQDDETELRVLACTRFDRFNACATHLSPDKPTGSAQCQELTKLFGRWKSEPGNSAPTVIAGDFNLRYASGSAHDVQNCLPPGHFRKGDGDVQHVMADDRFGFVRIRSFDLEHTDHPGLLLTLSAP
jgi:endonuclease/exonuclease/phosphatase family metal-dependent hydrolase